MGQLKDKHLGCKRFLCSFEEGTWKMGKSDELDIYVLS